MQRTYIKDLGGKVGEEVTIKGWVDICRGQTKLKMTDVRTKVGIDL